MVFKVVRGLVCICLTGLLWFCRILAILACLLSLNTLMSYLPQNLLFIVHYVWNLFLSHISYLTLNITSSEMQFLPPLSRVDPPPVLRMSQYVIIFCIYLFVNLVSSPFLSKNFFFFFFCISSSFVNVTLHLLNNILLGFIRSWV